MNRLNLRDIASLDSLIAGAARITVIGHMKPDGDAVGSGVAMLSFLESLGKDAAVVLPDTYPATLSFLIPPHVQEKVIVYEDFPDKASERLLSSDLILCQDFNSFSRTGDACTVLSASSAEKILIDHHPDPDRECFNLCFSDTEVSSTAELLYHILMEMPQTGHDAHNLPLLTATALMTGMTTDTNNFANSVFPTTLVMASELLEAGVDRERIIGNVFNSYGESRIRLMGYLLDKCLKITGDGVAYMILDRKAAMKFGIREGDTEGFVNIPLAIRDVRMSIFLKEDTDRFRVSIRSKKGISANLCARNYFNGGGHELASGGRLMIPGDVRNSRQASSYIKKVTHTFMTGQ